MGVRDAKDRGGDGSGHPGPKLPKGGKVAVGTVVSLLASLLAIVYRASLFEVPVLLTAARILLLLGAIGWIGRCVVHGRVGYFRRTEVEGAPSYTLLAVSCLNAAFSIAWLATAIFLLTYETGVLAVALAAVAICVFCFLLSLATHWAAGRAGLPRASEWMRERVRDPLEPGGSTPVGWILIKLIDWRSAPHYLSTFVAGTLATLLVVLVLALAAVISDRADQANRVLGTTTVSKQVQGAPSGDAGTAAVPQAMLTAPMGASGLVAGSPQGTTRLLCFIVSALSKQGPRQLFLCVVMSGTTITNHALVLAPTDGLQATG